MKHLSRALLVAVLALTTSCSGSPEKEDDTPTSDEGAAQQEPQSLEGSKCLGNRVPPTNYLQETAFAEARVANAADVAARTAKERLVQRICQGFRCNVIAPKVTLWHTEADDVQVCAMAVVKGAEVEAFLEEPRAQLDADIKAAGAELVEKLDVKGKPKIGIDNVRDIGVDGGPRAEWLIDKMSAALLDGGAVVAKLPQDWSGLHLPEGVDAVVSGRVTRLHGQESMLEVTWKLDVGQAVAASADVDFPELIGPVVDASTMMPDIDDTTDDLSLRFASRPGGGLCAGQRTELFLEAGKPLHTRVVNLFGDGSEGLVIYASDGALPADRKTSLGKVEVVPFVGEAPVERFLVFGADAPSELGAFEALPVPCRLPRETARKLSSGEGIPAKARGNVTTRSYRILETEDCADFSTNPASVETLAKIPMCW